MRRGERPAGDDRENLAGRDPGFVDVASNDFRLQAASPAVGAGSALVSSWFEAHPLTEVYVPHQGMKPRKSIGAKAPHIGALEVIGERP